MASLRSKYKKLKTFDKVFIPSCAAIVVGLAGYFGVSEGGINPFLAGGIVLLIAAAVHLVLTKPYDTIVMGILAIQILAFMPVVALYGFIFVDAVGEQNSLSASSVYVLAASYLIPWAAWSWATGKWWLKMVLALTVFDFAIPAFFLATGIGNPFLVFAVGILLVGLIVGPWRSNKRTIAQIPDNVKEAKVTESMFSLIGQIDGIIAQKVGGEAIDFVVTKGKTTFHVCVLGLNRTVKFGSGTVQYGPDNIKPLLYQAAVESKVRFKSHRHIPVVVNFSDKGNSFVEVNAALKSEERRARHVIVTTPPVLIDIINKA